MKKLRILLTAIVLLCSVTINAHNFYVDGIYYNITDIEKLTVEVTYRGVRAGNCYSGNIVIPVEVIYESKTYSVTNIGDFTFYNCSNLTSVTIPNSVTSIGRYAFFGCSRLTSVTIPNSVISIGDVAFGNCSSLTSVTIGYGVTSIGGSAFLECTSLTSITIPNCVTCIGDCAFKDCISLTSITIPNSVTSIGYSAFYGTAWYNNQPVGLVYAGKVAYKYKGTMPNNTSIELAEGTLGIAGSAFSGCSNLTSITIPNSVTRIGRSAFYDCSSLTSITIPNSVTSIGDYTFYGCSSLTSVTIPNSVASIGDGAFYGTAWYNNQPDGLVCAGKVVYKYKGIMPNNTSIELVEGTLGITGSAFSGCSNLTSITIPNSVTNIGSYAFSGCSNLTSITIPNSVTNIGSYAFDGCSNLTSIHISDIAAWCNIKFGDAVFRYKWHLFIKGKEITELIIPDGITTIGNSAFSGCRSLTLVTIGNSVTRIGSSAFYDCSSLTSITIPNSVISIGDFAFSDCGSLTLVTIGNSVTSIGSSAFSGCYNLRTVINNSILNLTKGSTSNGCVACYAYRILTGEPVNGFYFEEKDDTYYLTGYVGDEKTITLPNSYKGNSYCIGEYAFTGCIIKTMVIGAGVLSIGSDQSTPVKTIWLTNTPPSGYSQLAGEINYVANEQYGSMSNKKVYKYLSSMFEVDGITYVPVNPSERTCDVIDGKYYETVEKLKIEKTVSYKNIVMTVNEIMPFSFHGNKYIKAVSLNNNGNIGSEAFYNCTALQKATISNNGNIDSKAFYNCKSLITATFGDSIKSLGGYAFSGCKQLKEIIIPNAVKSLGEYCFENCSAMNKAIIGGSVETINRYAFTGCSYLPELTIPKSTTSIGDYAFSGCTGLKKFVIEDREATLKLGSNGSIPLFNGSPLDYVYIGGDISYSTSSSYGYSPFYRNTSLREVVITDKETEISANEFYGCTNLQNFTVGDGVTKFGDWAFSGCSSLKKLSFGSQLKTIGKEAFSDCVNVTKLISHAATPPTCGSQALDDINKWECTLLVPQQSLAAYQVADQWKEFFFIEGIDTGIDGITVDGKQKTGSIYNLRGGQMQQDKSTLPSGIYIQNGKKFIVK